MTTEKELEAAYDYIEELKEDWLDAKEERDKLRNHLVSALMTNLAVGGEEYEKSEDFMSAVRVLSGTTTNMQYISELKLRARQLGHNVR